MTALSMIPLKDRLRRPPLRVQLTVLYAGLFALLVAAVLAVSGLLVRQGSTSINGGSSSHNAIFGHHFNAEPMIVAGVGALTALGLAWWIAGGVLRPLRTMNAAAREISATNLHRRLGMAGPTDELAELGNTLDDLFARLESAFDAQRRFVANASHELRTPLAGLQTLLEVALGDPDADAATLRSACQEALNLSGYQQRLIQALLTLATSERGVEQWQPFDLATITDTVIAARREPSALRNLHIHTTLAPALATGDPKLVEVLVANLIDNAIRHNITGGSVEVSTSSAQGRATITVSNTGPNFAPGEVKQLFQPFQRAGSQRIGQPDGSGLGLVIVQAIARAHHAEITSRPSPQGGLDVTVTFDPSSR
jgi:signal transduction histidine kinase